MARVAMTGWPRIMARGGEKVPVTSHKEKWPKR